MTREHKIALRLSEEEMSQLAVYQLEHKHRTPQKALRDLILKNYLVEEKRLNALREIEDYNLVGENIPGSKT